MNSLNFKNAFNEETGNVGDHFQKFVFELLRKSDYPKLHKFTTAGKDGGIDLIQQLNRERTVVECKYIGDNNIEEAKKRWKTVKKHLETQLATKPPKEKQYKPWLKSDTPISSYLFCVSSQITNQNGFDEFEKEITDCFKNLAASHSHLKHLENINVEIIDWSKLLQKIDNFPQLKFKWFPLAEKFGFIPIQNKSSETSFRTFLEEESLPFYNRSKHLEKEPNADIQDEEQLLEMLQDTSLHGLIITGNGGTGKTRLTFELGRLAFKKDWLVFRCKETVNADNLTRFAETIADDTKVLMLMDYVETQKHFTDITEQLPILNDNYGFQIKYVANCRSSYYPTIRSTPNHHQVLLTSSLGYKKADDLWLEQYQASVVRHILEQGGIQIQEKHLAVCKNKPILAVFLLYLHQKSQGEELENLLNEADFGKWIQKRTKMSFVNVTDFELKLAKLAAMLPFSEEVCNEFDEFNSKLLGILANDGWIEKLQNNEWRSIHDVFADQIILSYTQDNPYFVEKFIRDIFSFAYSTNCLESAFITIQRLAQYLDVDFNKLLNAEIDKELLNWKKIRNYLLETSLLQESQKLDLLSNETLWEYAEKDFVFQTNLGTIIRRIVEIAISLTEAQQSEAKFWLHKTLPFISSSNFLLTWALKLSPTEMKELALNQMRKHPTAFRSVNLFSAWLESQLPTSEIEEFLGLWLDKHQVDYKTTFIYQPWLKAKGNPEFLKKYLKVWLNRHQTVFNAHFIYQSWLKAKGETEFIKNNLKAWLNKHETDPNARHIYESWIDAEGDPCICKEHLKIWVARNRKKIYINENLKAWIVNSQTNQQVGLIIRNWLEAKGGSESIKEHLKEWLVENQTNIDAGLIIKSWIDAKGDIAFIKENLKAWLVENQTNIDAGLIIKAWLDAKGDTYSIKEYLGVWLDEYRGKIQTELIITAWLDAKGETDFVKENLKACLVEIETNADAILIITAWLKAKGDPDFIKQPLKEWLDKHQATLEAGQVIRLCLEVKGDTEFIGEYMKAWLKNHHGAMQTEFIVRAWLRAKGDPEFIKEYLKAWIVENQMPIQAILVMRDWCEARGDTEVIKEHLKEWLDKHQATNNGKFLCDFWLIARGETEILQKYLKNWLEIHQTAIKTANVYKSWLDAQGDTDFIKEYLKAWLVKHQTTREANLIYSAWLNAGGEFGFIKEFAINWLSEYHDKDVANKAIKWLVKQSNLPIESIRYVLLWCNEYYRNEDAVCIIASFKNEMCDSIISNIFLAASKKVIDYLFLRRRLGNETVEQIITIFFNLFSFASLQDENSSEQIDKLFIKWIKHFDPIGQYETKFSNTQGIIYLMRFALLIEKNLLDVYDDRLSIERFLHYFNNSSSDNRQQLQPIIRDLQTKYPSDVWEIVTFS